jgi:hypothetical protein
MRLLNPNPLCSLSQATLALAPSSPYIDSEPYSLKGDSVHDYLGGDKGIDGMIDFGT